MKRILSLFMAFLMVLAVCPVLAASESTPEEADTIKIIDLVKMSSANDVTAWGTGNYGNTMATVDDASDSFSAYSPYSLYINSVPKSNYPMIQYSNLSVTIPEGYTRVIIPVYCDKDYTNDTKFPNGTGYKVFVTDTDKKDINHNKSSIYYLNYGWNYISAPVPSGKTISKIGLLCYKGPADLIMDESPELYINGAYLATGIPEQPSITQSSVKEGDRLVKHNLEKIVLTAPKVNELVKLAAEVTIEPEVEFTLEAKDGALTVKLQEEMSFGTEYKLSYSGGLYDEFGMEFKEYTLNFRTRAEDENIPPEVELISPQSGDRYLPEDEISLSARATDENGTIEYVEFYCNGNLIENSRTTSDSDVYTFVWTNAEESVSNLKITAKAVDNDNAEIISDEASIRVIGYKNPTIEIKSPVDGSLFYKFISGIEVDTKLSVEASISDLDDEVTKVEVFLNGDKLTEATENLAEFSYTSENSLEEGDYTLTVTATDDYGNSTDAVVNFSIKSMGKKVPALLEEDFEKYADGDAVDWSKSGDTVSLTAAELVGNKAAKLATEAAGEVSASKRYRNSLSGSAWEADVRIRFSDTTHERSVILSGESEGAKIVFKSGGDILVGDTTLSYKKDEWYEVRMIVDPDSKTLYALIDDNLVLTKTGLSDTFSRNGASIKVTQKGNADQSGYVLFDDAGIYKLDESSVKATGMTLYNGGAPVADTTTTPLSTDSFSVSLTEGMGSSLENNVWVLDTEENRKISLTYSDNKVFFNEMLRGNRAYSVVVSTGVSSDSSQTTIAKSGVFTFTTAPADAEVTEATFKVGGSEVDSLPDTVTHVSCELPFVNHSGGTHEMEIVAVVYNGDKMTNIAIEPWTVTTATDTLAVTVPVSEYTQNTRIEVFVVEDMDDMKPISDTIFQIK